MAELTPMVSRLSDVILLFLVTVENLAIASSTEVAYKAPCQDLIELFEDLQAILDGVPTRSFDSDDKELFLYQEFKEVKTAANRWRTQLSRMMTAMWDHLRQICAASQWPASQSWMARKLSRTQASAIIEDMQWKIAAAHQHFRTATQVMSQESFVALIFKAEAALPRISNSKIDHEHHKYLSGTMTSLLEGLEGWIADDTGRKSTDQRVRYLTGGAYTGKSTATAEFCQRLAVQGLLGASFRCNDARDNETKLLFPTLAVQLTKSQPALRQHIVAAAKDLKTPWDVMEMEDICHTLLRNPLRALPKDHPPIYIVIDAFEECERRSGFSPRKEQVTMLLRLLIACASERHSCLRILLVSRPDAPYIHELFASPTISPYIYHLQGPRFTETDVCAVFKDAMRTCRWGREWCSSNPDAIEHVAMRAQGWIGMFNIAGNIHTFRFGIGSQIHPQSGSRTQILDILQPLRSIVIFDEPYCPDSGLHFLHPTLRDVLVGHQWPVPIPTKPEVTARLTIGSFSEYAQQCRPPPVTDVGDLRYAFSYMDEHKEQFMPVQRAAWSDEEEADLVDTYRKLDSRTVDELFLWMCVTPRVVDGESSTG
ncbi:hypothetical protein C8Q80DRAFT_1287180 [Daedaleopsis nitida]|nr:hypothetical protein C8Q80DRAFT_1287180 [Daedaleopsis nitida]